MTEQYRHQIDPTTILYMPDQHPYRFGRVYASGRGDQQGRIFFHAWTAAKPNLESALEEAKRTEIGYAAPVVVGPDIDRDATCKARKAMFNHQSLGIWKEEGADSKTMKLIRGKLSQRKGKNV